MNNINNNIRNTTKKSDFHCGLNVKCSTFLNYIIIYLVISVIYISSFADAFNLDTATALVQRGNSGTHFGFSVSQHKDRGVSW